MSFSVHQRKTSVSEEDREKVIDLFKAGQHPLLIKKTINCSLSKIHQILRIEGLTKPRPKRDSNFWPRF